MNLDPKLSTVTLVADYSMESHAKDHDNYVNVSRIRKRRAKALLGKNFHLHKIKAIYFNFVSPRMNYN